MTKNLHYIWK